MGNKAIYESTVPSKGAVVQAHQNILRMYRNGAFENITGDLNNLNPTPTGITIQREVYGTKGRQSTDKIGDNWQITFNAEGVRNASGELVAAQAWLQDLLAIAFASGDDNKARFDWFDALAGALPAFEGVFSVAVAPWNTGYADKGGWTFTLTNDGVVEEKVSPIAGSGEPVIDSALPADVAEGGLVYVRGVLMGAVTAATIGGTAAGAIYQAPGDLYTVILEMPAGAAGSAPIVVTTAKGASDPLPYVRGA